MAKDDLYTVAQTGPREYHVVKYDNKIHWEEGFYTVKRSSQNNLFCDCFAGRRHTCRHREMVRLFAEKGKIGSQQLYSYDKQRWE